MTVQRARSPKKPVDSTKAFADAARNGFKKDMSEGVAGDGGYTVPEDIQNRNPESKVLSGRTLSVPQHSAADVLSSRERSRQALQRY